MSSANQKLPTTEADFLKEGNALMEKIKQAKIPLGLKEKCLDMFRRLGRMSKFGGYISEYEKIVHYLDWVLSLPWQIKTEDKLDLEQAKKILDENHYGIEEIKERILEYMAVLKLNAGQKKISRAPILCLVGLVGAGKTTFSYSLARALGRNFGRVPFGGMGSALDLRGQSRLHPDNEPGQIVKALKRCQSNNPVILLDEIDRVSENARADIMGVLIELLDPEQNEFFTDHYIDYPFDLSDTIFVTTCNNTTNISTAVLDRLEVLHMPSYTDDEKIKISKDYVLPRVMKKCGLKPENLEIEQGVWPQIVRPLGFDAGIRTLERTIEGLCRKIAKKIVMKEGMYYQVNSANVKEYLPEW